MSSLHVAARHPVDADGLVEVGGINNAGGYAFSRADLRAVRGRKLFVSAQGDVYGGAGGARQRYGWAAQPKRLVILPRDRALRPLLLKLIVEFVAGTR